MSEEQTGGLLFVLSGPSGVGKDAAIARMKEEAAKLGANGILLQGVQDQQSGSIGTGVGSSSYGPSSSTGVGVGGSFGIYNKVAHGIAIFVPPQ